MNNDSQIGGNCREFKSFKGAENIGNHDAIDRDTDGFASRKSEGLFAKHS